MEPALDHSSVVPSADRAPADRRANTVIRLMAQVDIDMVGRLIAQAMNPAEAEQAAQTFHFHFGCQRHGLDDGRKYYVLSEQSIVYGIAGLHHYVWGPPENVWLAWFAVDPALREQGLGKLLLDHVTREAQQLGYMKFYIETYSTAEFTQARAFYRAQGFAQVGGVQSYLPGGGDMVAFYKELNPNV